MYIIYSYDTYMIYYYVVWLCSPPVHMKCQKGNMIKDKKEEENS